MSVSLDTKVSFVPPSPGSSSKTKGSGSDHDKKTDSVGRKSLRLQAENKDQQDGLSTKLITTSPSNQTTKKTASCFEKFLSFLKKTCRQIAACLKLLITTNRNYDYNSTSSIGNRTLSTGLLGGRGMREDSSPLTLTPLSSSKGSDSSPATPTSSTEDDLQQKKEKELSEKAREAAKKKAAREAAREKDAVATKPKIRATLASLSKHIKIEVENTQILGLPNITGNNCYMNASLQLLDSALRNNEAYLKLIEKPLSREKNQSLIDFEEKVLSGWAKLEREASETTEHFERRILFKWSFLVLMQAKNCSKDGDVRAALRNFHKACFHLGLSTFFDFQNDRKQEDAAEFLTFWGEILNFSLLATYARSHATLDGERLIGEAKIEPITLIPVPARDVALMHAIDLECSEDIKKIRQEHASQISECQKKSESVINKKKKRLQKLRKNLASSKKNKEGIEKQKELEQQIKTLNAGISRLETNLKKEKQELARERNRQIKQKITEANERKKHFDAKGLFDQLVRDEDMEGLEFDGQAEKIDGYREFKLSTLENGVLPEGFFLQFKRFEFGSKIDSKIDFSNAMRLNLKDYLSEETLEDLELADEEFDYEITSFSVHKGKTAGSGHYISYVKRDGVWYKCNDSIVQEITEQELPIEQAYVCYYQKSKKINA